MVHASEVTQIIIGLISLLALCTVAVSTNQVASVSTASLAAQYIPGRQYQAPSYKNSRSTRRERRNQQPVSIIV